MSEIDTYLESLEVPKKEALSRVRALVREMVPDAVEAVSYGMPAFIYKNKYLVGYRAFKRHLSIFPTAAPIEALRDQLGAFKISKGTIQFTLDNPIPEGLLKQLVLLRAKAITEG